MIEGSLWVYGNTDLSDYYNGRLTFRQLVNRLDCLPREAPYWQVWRDEYEKAQARQQVAEVENALARFKPPRR